MNCLTGDPCFSPILKLGKRWVTRMTNVVTVSASTAAYAVEPVKPAQRVTGSAHYMEDAIKRLAAEAARADDPRQRSLLNVVRPPALALFFLTAPGRAAPAVSPEQVERAYLDQMDDNAAREAQARVTAAEAAETAAVDAAMAEAHEAEAEAQRQADQDAAMERMAGAHEEAKGNPQLSGADTGEDAVREAESLLAATDNGAQATGGAVPGPR